jgi:hypothetical protein
MSAPDQCEVAVVEQLPDEARRHPLAHRSGIDMLVLMLTAEQHWRPLSRKGKAAIRSAYTRALRDAVAAGLDRVPLPALPDGTHKLTARALERRGLAHEGRLTGLAVEVYRWAGLLEDTRPVETIRTGGAL